jgi:hypothetical protein
VCERERERERGGSASSIFKVRFGRDREIEGRERYRETYKHTELTIKIPSKAQLVLHGF